MCRRSGGSLSAARPFCSWCEAARRCMRLGCLVTLPGRRAASYKNAGGGKAKGQLVAFSQTTRGAAVGPRGDGRAHFQKTGRFCLVNCGASGSEVRCSEDGTVLGLANGWFLVHERSRSGKSTADVTLEKRGRRFVLPVLREFEWCNRGRFASRWCEG